MSELGDLFERNAERAGFVVHRDAGGLPDACEISTAVFGLADTGSVVLAASPDEPRARHLLSPTHVTRLERSKIIRGLAELFAAFDGDLPSALAIVTGPSLSADIGQELITGIHGPREVHVVIVDS